MADTTAQALQIVISAIDNFSPAFDKLKAALAEVQAMADEAGAQMSGAMDAASGQVDAAAQGMATATEEAAGQIQAAVDSVAESAGPVDEALSGVGTAADEAAAQVDGAMQGIAEQADVAAASVKDLKAQLADAQALLAAGVKSPQLDAEIASLLAQIAQAQEAQKAATALNATVADEGKAAAGAATEVAAAQEEVRAQISETIALAERENEIFAAMAASETFGQGGGFLGGATASMKKFGAQAKEVGTALTMGLTVPILGVAAGTGYMAGQFQKDMELIHTQARASQAQVDALSGSVLSLAGPTATAPDELTKGLYHLVSASGVTAQTMDELKVAAEGAKLGGADLESVTNALNAAMVSGIGGISNASQAMGVLNATVGAGDMHMQDLAQALGTGVLATIKGFGVSAQEAGAALAVFGDNNIRGAHAGTQLRMAVQALAAPVKGGASALKEIGLTANDLATALSDHGLNGALKLLSDHMEAAGKTGDQAGEILTRAFGKRAGVGIQVLDEQFTRFQKKLGDVSAAGNSFTQDWTDYTKTAAYQWSSFVSEAEAVGTKLGTALLPALNALLKTALEPLIADIQKLVTWFTHLNPTAQRMIEIFAGMVAAIGPLALVVGAVMSAFAVLATPVGAVVLAFAAAAAIADVVVTHWTQIKQTAADMVNWLKTQWDHLKTWTEGAFSAIIDFFKKWGPLMLAALTGPVGLLVYAIATHWTQIKNDATAAWNAITGALKDAWNGIKSAAATAWNGIKNGVVDAFSWMYNHNYYFKDLVDFIRKSWATIKADAQAIWGDITGALGKAWDAIKSFAKTFWDDEVRGWTNIWNAIKSAAESVWKDITSWLKGQWDQIKSFGETAWNAIVKLVGDAWSAIKRTIENMLTPLLQAAEKPFDEFRDWMNNLQAEAIQWGENLIHGIVKGIEGAVKDVEKAASDVAHSIASFLGFHSPPPQGPAADSDTWMPNMVSMFSSGITAGIPQVQSAMNGIAGTITNTMQGAASSAASMAASIGNSVAQALGGNTMWKTAGGLTVSASDLDPSQYRGLQAVLNAGGSLSQGLAGIGIPHMAAGGIVDAPTLAMIGEAGREAVLPLDQYPINRYGVRALPASAEAGGGQPIIVNVNVSGSVVTQKQLGDWLISYLAQKLKMRGNLAV